MVSSSSAGPSGLVFDPKQVHRVGIIGALHKRRIGSAVEQVVGWLQGRGLHALLSQEQAGELSLPDLGVELSELVQSSDLLLAMGGDGTFLATARLGAPHGKPIIGVNLGGFGFLASIPSGDAMLKSLEEVMSGRLRVQERMMLQARVLRKDEEAGSFLALNDVVVGKGAFSRLFRLRTDISGEPVSHFPADGIIVSTPTGSTGYSLSAGGPVVDPEVRVILVTPICAHALSARTLVVPPERVVEIALPDPRSEEVNLTADGQEGCALGAGNRIEVRQAPFSARLVMLPDTSFYRKLRGKLGWGAHR
jgi:NAD+ kinase